MRLLVVGCNFRTTPVELREKLAFAPGQLPHALHELQARYGCEAAILSTCNRVELYLAPTHELPPRRGTEADEATLFNADLLTEFLGEWHRLDPLALRPHIYEYRDTAAVRHLFRVAASLDSLIVGEAQIAGQVKQAYDLAQQHGTAGVLLHALFQSARAVVKRVRSETGIAQGRVSVSSAAVEYVRQVFSRFDDKTILVIGAGKMGELTLKHLRELRPKNILVTNRSFAKAQTVAQECSGQAWPWEHLDDALGQAHIILSTTGAPDVIVNQQRWQRIQRQRGHGPVVILDIAVPRDFDPAIHDGEDTWLFNIDDLQRIRAQTLQERQKHIAPAEAIVEQEVRRFVKDWQRRRNGPVIARLIQNCEAIRQANLRQLFQRRNGELSPDVRADIEGMTRLLVNQILHGPISALTEEATESGSHGLLEALRKLFRLQE